MEQGDSSQQIVTQNVMEQEGDYSLGLEAVTRGMEAAAKGAKLKVKQQTIVMVTWEQQMKTNIVMSKEHTMGDFQRWWIAIHLKAGLRR